MFVGYILSVTQPETLPHQQQVLRQVGCAVIIKIYEEKKSGAAAGALRARPRLEACLEYVREGDTLVITWLDRLARSTLHLCQIAEALKRKQVNL